MTNLEKLLAEATPRPWNTNDGSPDIGITTDKVLVAMVTNDEDAPCSREEQDANARLITLAGNKLGACVALLERAVQDMDSGWAEDADRQFPWLPDVRILLAAIEEEAGR